MADALRTSVFRAKILSIRESGVLWIRGDQPLVVEDDSIEMYVDQKRGIPINNVSALLIQRVTG